MAAGIDDTEMRATFNGGLGMIAITAPDEAAAAIRVLGEHGVPATVAGAVVPSSSVGGARYVEEPSA